MNKKYYILLMLLSTLCIYGMDQDQPRSEQIIDTRLRDMQRTLLQGSNYLNEQNAQAAIPLFEKVFNSEFTMLRIAAALHLGRAYLKLGQIEQARHYLTYAATQNNFAKVKQIAEQELNNITAAAIAPNALVAAQQEKQIINTKVSQACTNSPILRTVSNNNVIVNISHADQMRQLITQSQEHIAHKEYKKAIELLYKAFQQNADPYVKNLAAIKLATIYLMEPKTKDWAETLLLPVARNNQFSALQATAIITLVNMYAEQKRFDKVHEFLQKALFEGKLLATNKNSSAADYLMPLSQQNYNLTIKYIALYDLGLTYLAQNRSLDAENSFIQVAKQDIDPQLKAFALLDLGKLYIARGQQEKALWYLEKALNNPYTLLFDAFKALVLKEIHNARYSKQTNNNNNENFKDLSSD